MPRAPYYDSYVARTSYPRLATVEYSSEYVLYEQTKDHWVLSFPHGSPCDTQPVISKVSAMKFRRSLQADTISFPPNTTTWSSTYIITNKMAAKRRQTKKKPEPEPEPSSSSSSSSSSEEESSDGEDAVEPQQNKLKKADEGFTDDNAAWLKPKKKQQKKTNELLSSSDEDEASKDDEEASKNDDGDDNDEDDDDELLDIEREAAELDQEAAMEQEEAAEEMQHTIREHTAVYHLPTADELKDSVDRVVPPSELRAHVESILEVLADFHQRREPGRSRQEYLDRLGGFLAELYGYLPELVEYFLTMFSPAEAVEFIAASDQPRPLTIRTNTLKTRRKDLAAALIKRGVSLDPLASWSKVGLKIIESSVPIGATPEYLSGHYMLQSAASLCPVLALNPQPKEICLDMSSAPGGKTSYMAQLMRNTGVLFANDAKPARQKATVANLHRLGVTNTITTAHDGRKLGGLFRNRFDRVLLDAPCSGLGVISRDPSVKVQRTIADVKQCAHLQKELLLAAIDCVKWKHTTNSDGGVLVYSTCSVSILENEEVVQYALQKRDIQIVDTGLQLGSPGFVRYQQKRFHPSMALCRRLYPHTVNMDGFFVCKIKKLSDKKKDAPKSDAVGEDEAAEEPVPVAEEKGKETTTKATKEFKSNGDKKLKHKKGRKRKLKDGEKVEMETKKSKVAQPPKKPKAKMNAKVTKPRRPKKQATDA